MFMLEFMASRDTTATMIDEKHLHISGRGCSFFCFALCMFAHSPVFVEKLNELRCTFLRFYVANYFFAFEMVGNIFERVLLV